MGEFKTAVKDDKAAIKLMEKAKEALVEYYKKNKVEFVQESPMEDPDVAPDASFSGKGKRKQESKGIVAIMTMLIEDLGNEIKEATKDEDRAQADFEKAMEKAEKLKKDLEEKKVHLKEVIADRKQSKVD